MLWSEGPFRHQASEGSGEVALIAGHAEGQEFRRLAVHDFAIEVADVEARSVRLSSDGLQLEQVCQGVAPSVDDAQPKVAAVPEGAAHSRRREPRKIRYSDAEWAIIAGRARECGRAPARYVREVSLGAVPKARRSHANAELIRELGRVCNVLTQVAGALRESDAAAEAVAIEHALAELLTVVRRLD